MKNGAPKNAVTTPIGVSAGFCSTRPGMSARTRNAPPTDERQRQHTAVAERRPAAGRSAGPRSRRTPIKPLTDTTAAVPSVGRDHDDEPHPCHRRARAPPPRRHRRGAGRGGGDGAAAPTLLTTTYGSTSRTSAHVAVISRPRIQLYTSRMTSPLRCRMNAWMAVASDVTRNAGQHERHAGRGGPPNDGADQVRDEHGEEPADERRERHRVDHPARRTRRRRRYTIVAPSPAPAATPEQVRIDERVAEHALVARPGERQHRADEPAEHDPRHAHVPDDVPLGLRHAAVDADERQPVGQLQRDAPPLGAGRTDHHAEQHGERRARRRRRRATTASRAASRARARRRR